MASTSLLSAAGGAVCRQTAQRALRLSPRRLMCILLLVCLCAQQSVVRAALSVGRATPLEGHTCMHGHVEAAQDAYLDGQKIYARTVRRDPAASPLPRAVFQPRRGATPASLNFELNATTIAATDPILSSTYSSSSNAEDGWQSIRVRAFFEDLTDSSRYCTAVGQVRPGFDGTTVECTSTADILTDQKKDILMNTLVPTAIQMHAERLSVQRVPADASIVVSSMGGRYCGSFTVPADHYTTGVSDADLVIYVAAGPTSTPTSFIAWALTCQYLPQTGRPAVGVIYFNPRYLVSSSDETAADIAAGGNAFSTLDNRIRVAAHELLHAMGFTYGSFVSAGMVSTVADLRGKPNVRVISSQSVRAAAAAHFGCSDMDEFPGMELEDQAAAGSSDSHWKRRNAFDEMMSPVANAMRYTAITIAAMQDLGFYKANYTKAEYMGWGYNVGCAMVTEKCIPSDVTLTPTVPSVFCSTGGKYCTRDRLSIGMCSITTYTSDLPTYMQYFTTPTEGGGVSYVDYCPTVQGYSNTRCSDGTVSVMQGSTTGNNARCFDASNTLITKSDFATQSVICASVQCNFTTEVYHVQVSGATTWSLCTPGGTIEPAQSSSSVFQSGGLITCPSFEDVCAGNTQASFALPTNSGGSTTKTDGAEGPIILLALHGGAPVLLLLLLAVLLPMTAAPLL